MAGFSPEREYTPKELAKMLKDCGLGTVKVRVIDGWVPCCYAVIYKESTD